MVKQNPTEIEQELKKQQKDFGDDPDEFAGESDEPMDVDEAMEKVTGNAPLPKKSLNIAKEVEDDEKALQEGTEDEHEDDNLDQEEE